MNKFASKIIVTLLIVSYLANAQGAENNSLLWRISGNDLPQESYLYGTIHIICEANVQINKPTAEAFQKAEKVYLELDLDDPALIQEMRASSVSKSHLRNHISTKGYQEIDEFFSHKLGYSMEAVGMVKPYYLLTFAYKPNIGCENPISIEQLLVKETKEAQKEIRGLETLDQQTAVFDQLSTRKQARILLRQIRRKDSLLKNYTTILDFYQKGNVDQLQKAAIKRPARRLNKLLLNQRNEAWAASLKAILPQQSNFIAVGAAHLGGNKGLIKLLRKQGYTVEAVN